MGKCLALQMCYTSKGRMVPRFEDAGGKTVWSGDIEELPDEEITAFGKKHLKPVPATSKIRRYDVDVMGKPGKTLTTESKKTKAKNE